jgi:hypothetical protein
MENSVVRGCKSLICYVNSFLPTRVSYNKKTEPWYLYGVYCKIMESSGVGLPVGTMLVRGR